MTGRKEQDTSGPDGRWWDGRRREGRRRERRRPEIRRREGDTRGKASGEKATGTRETGVKATAAQDSQETGGKGDMSIGEREMDNLPGVTTAGQNATEGIRRKSYSEEVTEVQAHGIGDGIIELIEYWLTDRRQRVVVDGDVSNWKSVLSGVPQ